MSSDRLVVLDARAIDAALLRTAGELTEELVQPAIILDLSSLATLPASALERVAQWSQQQPCPVIGLGGEDAASVQCVDVVVESRAELATLVRRISANPQAATVLVQVLRAIACLPPLAGLVVESLGYATLQTGTEFQRWLTRYRAQNPPATPAGTGPAIVAERQGDVMHLVLNRPQNDNAF